MFDASTYPALLAQARAAHPDRVFLQATSATGDEHAVTFAELDERSRRVATGLLARGLSRGDRVAVAAPNVLEWLELFFGATRIGVIVVTLNVRYRESELDHMLNQSGARLVVSAANADGFDFESFYAGFRGQIPGVEDVLFLGATGRSRDFSALAAEPDVSALSAAESLVVPDDPAVILYTSGTTGRPKGAVLTHASMLASARAQADRLTSTPEDVYLCVMPLNHVGGITCNITTALLTGSEVVLHQAFSPPAVLSALRERRVSFFVGVPTMWSLVVGRATPEELAAATLRIGVIGGSNVEPTLARQILEAFPGLTLANLYGLSESSGAAVISAPGDTVETISRSIGTPLTGVAARVVGLDGAELPAGSEGELQLRGPSVAAGYWERPEATAETFGLDGWLATGDMVSIEADGHVLLRGRRKEMFLQGGYNVYPVEVENVLTAHPAVAMAAGIGVPDPVLGEVGCYFLVLRPGMQVTEEELLAHCRSQVADYKVPRRFVIVDELPTTPSGKIAKAALRETYDAS